MWKFYYDEAFHDRNITIKKDLINVYLENNSDIYVGFFCGYKDIKKAEIWKRYILFENKYKEIYTIDEGKEFKATIIKKKNYKNGFSSFVDNTINFYRDFFKILDDSEIIFHISMFSKTELIVIEFLKNINFKIDFHKESFLYTIIKFLYNYRNPKILKKFMSIKNEEDIEKVLSDLKIMIQNVIEKAKSSKKKVIETNALEQILIVLDTAYVSNFKQPQLSWRYEPIFIGFNKLLCERKINQTDVNLLIDEENSTLEAAKKIGNYNSCDEGKSHESIGIRISDILAHFFGELIIALECELKESEIMVKEDLDKIDYLSKKLLSSKWFKLSKEQFLLCQEIEIIFSKYQLYEWTGYDGVFCDYPVLMFALLEYVFEYRTYEDFMKVKAEEHSEYFNAYSCKKLAKKFIRGGSEPALV
ncbi:hypothetical protein HMPREF0379_1338 [[Eubacterium] yurii subsp. margaretiae ATCC 43715]|nr:hypothetical protein HMPREF0379_1338 [[Eubacterium] yurii subsp. margaretiae ATCC 43715]